MALGKDKKNQNTQILLWKNAKLHAVRFFLACAASHKRFVC